MFARKADTPVRIVLDDHHVIFFCKFHDFLAGFDFQRLARRVGKIRHDIDEFRLVFDDLSFKIVRIHAVLPAIEADRLQTVGLCDMQNRKIGWVLHEDFIALVGHRFKH